MKKILFIILSFFVIFISSSIITKAAVSESVITIYEYNTEQSNEENSLDTTSSYFTQNNIIIEDIESNYTLENKSAGGWIFKGYYQYVDGEYTYFNANYVVKYDENSSNIYYEYWEKNTYEFTFYIYYNKSDVPQEHYIDENSLDYVTFISNFPTIYKNLVSLNFYNDEDKTIKISIDELYDIYIKSSIEGYSSHTIYTDFKVRNEIDDEPVDVDEEKFNFSEWWNEADLTVKIIIIITFLLFLLMIFTLFTGKRRYKKW